MTYHNSYGEEKRVWPIVAAIGTVVALTVGLIGFLMMTGISTQPDQAALHYKAGPISETQFSNCIPPSTRVWDGPGDDHYAYPARQRTYDFTGADGSEHDPFSVTDKDGVTLTVPGVATFTLNTACDDEDGGPLVDFHETVGIKYEAWTTVGWLNFLHAYMGNPLEKALDQASQTYGWRALLNDTTIRDAWEEEVGRLARQFAFDQSGNDFLCSKNYTGTGECGNFELTIQKPGVPGKITEALAETAAEVERKTQAENAQARVNVEAVTLQALTDVLGADAAVQYQIQKETNALLAQAIENGEVSVIPIPSGSGVLVNSQRVE